MGTITDKPEGMDTKESTCENVDCERNAFGSKLSDIKEINRIKDENLELKLIIGDMQLKIFKLSQKLKEVK